MMQTETHCHTKNVSMCGQTDAREMARLYKAAGYGALIVTDHYYSRYWESKKLRRKKWSAQIDLWLSGYRLAHAEGEKIGLKVFLGMEIMFDGFRPHEFLVYGMDEAFMIRHPYLNRMDVYDFYDMALREGFVMFQAHPYRYELAPVEPIVYDGIEVVNAHLLHNSHNRLAVDFAARCGIKMIAGSDAHRSADVARGGVIVPDGISSGAEFAEYYRTHQPELIVTFEDKEKIETCELVR